MLDQRVTVRRKWHRADDDWVWAVRVDGIDWGIFCTWEEAMPWANRRAEDPVGACDPDRSPEVLIVPQTPPNLEIRKVIHVGEFNINANSNWWWAVYADGMWLDSFDSEEGAMRSTRKYLKDRLRQMLEERS